MGNSGQALVGCAFGWNKPARSRAKAIGVGEKPAGAREPKTDADENCARNNKGSKNQA